MIRVGMLAAAALTLLVVLSSQGANALMVLNRGNGGEPNSLDPHFIDTTAEANIVGDMLIGLTTEDAAANPIPGAATSWNVSKDGKTWTFHIRNHVWSDGTPVTAQDFVFAWQRLIDPKTAASYAYALWIIKNAEAISDGKLPVTALGAKATDDRTLVVQLEHPASYLPELLLHHTADPLPRHVVLAKGNAWSKPQNYVVNGAYRPTQWVANDHVTLVKNSKFYDAAHVRIDVVNYYPTQDTQAALKRLRAGELDTQNPLPLANIDWIRAHMAAALRVRPYLGISYIAFNMTRPPLNDVRVRKAMNLAYNREVITQKVIRLGEPPAYNYVPPGVANYPGGATMDFKSLPYPERIRQAQALMQQAGYGPANRLHVTYETTFDPDSKRVAAVLQNMLMPIYIDLEIQQADLPIHFRNLKQHQFELGAAAWIADFNDATNFLDLFLSDGGNNYGLYKNPAFDAAMAAAKQQTDLRKRGAMLLDAEKMLIRDYPWIPTRFRSTENLVQPYVRGWRDNVRNFNRTRWLWIEGRPAAR